MIKLSSVSKTFNPRSSNEVKALQNVSLTIGEGEFLTVVGTNGSGKSTLLNVVSGTTMVDSGSIFIDGKDVTKKSDFKRAHAVSRVFQNPFSGTAPEMTIAENLLIAYRRGRRRFPVITLTRSLRELFKQRVGELEMQLEDRLDQMIGTLSGGQRQAITLLMAVLQQPKVLLLDEHTAALDPKTASQVIALTERFISRHKLTAVMITHSMQQALDLGSTSIMMYKGAIIDTITAKEKRRLTVDDLLGKFADLRKKEKLTDELLEQLRNEYA